MPAIGAIAGLAGSAATGAAGGVGNVLGALSGAVSGLLGPLTQVQQSVGAIAQLVGLFNPAIIQQFQLALNDTMAVLGSALVPVIQPLFDAIGQYVVNYAQGLVPIIEAAAPFIQLFTDLLVRLIEELSKGVAFFQGMVAELLVTLAQLFGLDESRFQRGASSAGFAARQTRVSSVQQFADEVFASNAKNVYSRQGGGKEPVQVMQEIKKAIEDGRETLQGIKTAAENIYNFLTGGSGATGGVANPAYAGGKAIGEGKGPAEVGFEVGKNIPPGAAGKGSVTAAEIGAALGQWMARQGIRTPW